MSHFDNPMTALFETKRDRVLRHVHEERDRQDEKWGEQNHPMVLVPGDRAQYATCAKLWQEENAQRALEGVSTWDGILLEEFYEAMAEEDPARQRAELIQVAAVAVAMIESLDRKVALGTESA